MELWRVRRYESEDDPKIDELLKLSLPGYSGLAKWEWIHKKNPLGSHAPDGDVWVAEASDKSVVGCYGKIRYKMHCFGKVVLASQALNMATHPDFRRKGVASELIASSQKDSLRNGFELIFGFPNANSYDLSIKQGGIDAGPASALLLVVNPGAYFAGTEGNLAQRTLFRAGYFLRGIGSEKGQAAKGSPSFELEEGFHHDVGAVGDSISGQFDVGLLRSREYLQWRYAPQWGDYRKVSLLVGGECQGYAVTAVHTRGTLVGVRITEFIARNDSPDVYDFLITSILERARQEHATHLTTSAAVTRSATECLRRHAFRPTTKWARYILFAYDQQTRGRIPSSRVYHSFGDRDYM